jgi:uncharacterized protein (TIGR02246 family)
MCSRFNAIGPVFVGALLVTAAARLADAQDDAAIGSVRKSAEQLVTAFNAAKVEGVTAMFLADGELIDEEGTIYRGSQEIKDLLTAFFAKYPGTKLSLDIESIRLAGPVAIEDGTRTMTTKDGQTKSQFRYISVWAKTEAGWRIASFRDFPDDSPPTPNESLQPIAWLIGDWINEGTDGKVAISYRWSDDKNFLLGEFQMARPGEPTTKSTQRIGWDPSIGKIRSWLFDADGGFAEGIWTVAEDDIVVKSSSVNPDGTTASATMTIATVDKDHFSIEGTDRIIGDDQEPDFEITVTRRPPATAK